MRLPTPSLLALLLQLTRSDAASVTAGAPEHLVTTGGECARVFHSVGSVGCRSLSSADMAPLYPIGSSSELQSFVSGSAEQQDADAKYVLVMAESLLSYEAIESGLGRIGGLFVYPESGTSNASLEAATPQGDGTVDGVLNPFKTEQTQWNPKGNGLMTQLLPFPVVMLQNATTGAEFTKRAQINIKAGAGATYQAFMNYYFGPEEMNSLKCLNFTNIYNKRSPKCDPIGGQSSWAMRGNLKSDEVVLAMAGMDATSMSHVLAPGANTGASGLVALLAAAHALKALPDSAFDKKVVFAAFQAEKFGFVGSRKFLSDLKKFTDDPEACAHSVTDSKSPMGKSFCTYPMLSNTEFANLKLANISYAIAVDQVGILPKSGNFTLHVNPHANDSSELVEAVLSAPSAASAVGEGSTGSLPPTPLSSFVNDGEFGQKDLVGAVLAGYDESYTSEGTYNSRHDEFTMLDVDAVVQAAQVLAESVFTLASSNATSAQMDKIEVDTWLVESMLSCISTDWNCGLMKNYSQYMVTTLIEYLSLKDSAWPSYSVPATLYPGPLNDDRSTLVMKKSNSALYSLFNDSWSDDDYAVRLFPNAYEFFTRSFLASAMVPNATADAAPSCSQNQGCENNGKGMECVHPGVCVTKNAFHHEASSPGLKRTTTALLYEVVNSSMPIWTEPQWASDIGSYSFPDPGAWIGWVTLAIGLAVTGAGVGLSFMVLGSVQKMKLI